MASQRFRTVGTALLFILALGTFVYIAPMVHPLQKIVTAVTGCLLWGTYVFRGKLFPRNPERTGRIVMFTTICVTVVFATVVFMVARNANTPETFAHDSLIQTEAAQSFLAAGINPYTADYRLTPLADWPWHPGGRENPALDHYAYLPFMFVSGMPFHIVFGSLFHWFDQRVVHLLFLFLAIFSVHITLRRTPRTADVAFILIFLNPFLYYYFIIGHNDIVVFSLLIFSWALLARKKPLWSSVALGAAIASKQSALVFLPLFVIYLWFTSSGILRERIQKVAQSFWPAFAIPLVFILPFIINSPHGFWEDTVLYLAGKGSAIFPIQGFGVSALLVRIGRIDDIFQSSRLFLLQMLTAAAILLCSVFFLRRRPSISSMILCGTVLLAGVWVFAQSFTLSHLAAITLFAITGALFIFREKSKNSSSAPVTEVQQDSQ